MSFKIWFKQWYLAFLGLLTFESRKRKSEEKRKKERLRRLKAKHSPMRRYRSKKRRKRRRGTSVRNEKMLSVMFRFVGATLAVLLLPFGLLDWGAKSVKASKARMSNAGSGMQGEKKKSAPQARTNTAAKIKDTSTEVKLQEKETYTPTRKFLLSETDIEPLAVKTKPSAEPDENTPKSTPTSKNDQYIRKRMIIAGSYYCDNEVLETLEVGTRFDLEAEPDNQYDKNAIKLTYNGRKIGYIAKQDQSAFITCLKLKRKIYGIITAVKNEEGQTKYEFETWFDFAN